MRSKFHFLTTGLATLFLLSGVSCSDDEASVPTPPGEGILTPPVLTLSAEEVLVEPEEPDQTVLHAEWSAATDDPEVDAIRSTSTTARATCSPTRWSSTPAPN